MKKVVPQTLDRGQSTNRNWTGQSLNFELGTGYVIGQGTYIKQATASYADI